ncbi:MAG: universal stress protein [Allomuricauda sp.]
MKPIVYATDYSENSISALKMAHALSQKLETRLIVLHVFDLNVAMVTPMSMTYVKMEKAAFQKHHEKLEEFCMTQLGLLPDNKKIQVVVRENALINDAIVDTVIDFDASLVIMGFKGKSALKDVLVGSSTKGMIDKCPCPVLAVPASVKNFSLKKITYATDFEEADIQAVDWVVKTVASPFKATVDVFHITTQDEYAGEDQMQWFQEMLGQKVSYKKMEFSMARSQDIFDTLLDHADQGGTDLLVMLEREKSSFLKSLTHTDLVKRMVSKGNVPLLSINKTFVH